jgi:DNA-binding LacI/PurR family transcriptional regulator
MSLLPADIEPASGSPVSQRDIARHFGVSHVTVSLALRNSTRVSAGLRQRILEHARMVGYRRDPLLTALKEYRLRRSCDRIHGAIAWIGGGDPSGGKNEPPAIGRFRQGAVECARELGFRLEAFRPDAGLTAKRLHVILSSRGIRGILLPPQAGTGWGRDFPWEDYLVVSLGRSDVARRCHQMAPALLANLEMAVEAMWQRGYRRIGCIAGNPVIRMAGYDMSECLAVARRRTGTKLPFRDLHDEQGEHAGEAAAAWLGEHRVDGVIFDEIETWRRLAMQPEFMQEAVPFATLDCRGEAGIDIEPVALGRAAVRLLCELIRDESVGVSRCVQQVALGGRWVDGASLPPAR